MIIRTSRVAALLALLLPSLVAAQGAEPDTSTYVPAPATKLPLKYRGGKTGAGISARDLMTRLYIFADDSMLGRAAGTIGNVRGTDYIAAEVKRMGLQPAGDDGTYFQTVPFKTREVDPATSFTVGGEPLEYRTEWATLAVESFTQEVLPVVYGGVLGDSSAQLSEAQTEGRLIVFRMPEGPGGMRALRSMGRLAGNAAAVAAAGADQILGFLARPATFVDDPNSRSGSVSRPALFLSSSGAARLFTAPLDQLAPGDTGRTASLDLHMKIEPVPYPARNVVAILPGRDPALKQQYIAIGAHNDHIGFNSRPVDHDSLRIFNHLVRPGGAEDRGKQATPEQQEQVNTELAAWRASHSGTVRPDSISNGADDDGSGSVSVLEIAEKLSSLKQRPRRSIVFVWHVAEENGLYGSAWFTDHPSVPRDSIVAQLNMDMVGRGNRWDVTGASKDGGVLRGNPDYLQIVGSRRLSTELGDVIEQVNTAGKHGMVFDYAMDANGHPMNIYCRSDHYMYARYGIPVAFFTTGGHSDYHQVTDEPQYIDYDHMARVDRLVEDVALHLANLDHRIVVDQPKPDPKGSCRQ